MLPAVASKCHRVPDLPFFAAVGKMNVVSPGNVVVVLVVVDIGVATIVVVIVAANSCQLLTDVLID